MAAALGWPVSDETAVPLGEGLRDLLAALSVPTRLSDVGISADQLAAVVDRMLEESPTLGARDRLRHACEAMI
jgi:alcohol dehydrogenase class IV